MIELQIQARETKGQPDTLRDAGVLPGVIYGHKEAAQPIQMDRAVFEKLWKKAGETTIIKLMGVGESKDSLIHEVEVHPVTGVPHHVDFYVLEKGKKIQIGVPISFIGTTDAEKVGGILVKVLHEIEIEVAPAELPQHLDVDVSGLHNIGDHIKVGDVKLPPSATLITDPEELVVSITEQKIVEEMPTKPPTDEEVAAAEAAAAPAEETESKEE